MGYKVVEKRKKIKLPNKTVLWADFKSVSQCTKYLSGGGEKKNVEQQDETLVFRGLDKSTAPQYPPASFFTSLGPSSSLKDGK